MRPIDADAGALTGAIISAAFALAWAFWGASGLPSGTAAVVRGLAVVLTVALIGRAARLRRGFRHGVRADSLFASRAYRRIVGLEVIGLCVGGALLGAAGEQRYTIAWFALIVGAHFVAFGRAFWAGFHVIGGVLVAAALAGAIIGLSGGSATAIRAVTGLTAAADLFLAGAWTVLGWRGGSR